jgi:hypothetical protein
LSGQAPKPHSSSVEMTFNAVSAITRPTAVPASDDRLGLAIVPELSVEQQHDRKRNHCHGKADEGPRVVMVTEQRRAVAWVSGHDVQQNLSRSESRAGDGGQQRRGVVARTQSEPDIQNRANREQGELDALEQAQGTRKLVQQQLRREGNQENQRDGVEAKRIEGQGERSSHEWL